MTTDRLIDILHSGHYSLVISNDGLHTYTGRGVADLYHVYRHERELLQGASVADKIVGKGAAALMALGGVADVTTDVISAPALSLLEECGIKVSYTKVVANIINRKGDGICPVEHLCSECNTPAECLPLIEQFMSDKN